MDLQTKDIVATKTINGNTFTYIIRITEISKSRADKSTRCNIEAVVKQSKSGTCYQNKMVGVACSVNGQQLFSDYQLRTLQGTGEHLYYRWSGVFSHTTLDGLELTVSGTYWINDPTTDQPKRLNLSGTMLLTPITNQCSIGASDASIGSNSTIVVTNDSDYTHSVHFRFGNAEGYIGEDGRIYEEEQKFTAKVISFCLPESFYEQIPNDAGGVCVLTMRAYKNFVFVTSAMGNLLVKTDKTLCAPLLSATVTDDHAGTVALTGDENRLIRFFSLPRCRVDAQGQKCATISSIQVNGQTIEEDAILAPAETNLFQFKTTDSRGYSTQQQVETDWIPYIRLTCTPMAQRTAPTTGQVALTVSGSLWQGNFGRQENTAWAKCRVADAPWQEIPLTLMEDHRYIGTTIMEGLDYTRAHVIEIQVGDALDMVETTTQVSKGTPVFSWGEDYFRFHVPVCFEAGTTELT